jgi:hypothetical protein
MSPIKHRTGGRRFGGGFDTQRVERFAPGNRGEAFGANTLWSTGIDARMANNGTGTGALMRSNSTGVPADMDPGA